MRLKFPALILWLGGAAMFVLLAGCFGPDLVTAARSYTWRETPCTILKSRIVEEPFSSSVTHHVLKVEYCYTFGGREFVSTRFTTGAHQGSADVSKAQQAAVRFAAGTSAMCYVNSRHPAEAVLERGQLWEGLFLFAPFLLMGLIGHEEIFAWFEGRRARRRIAGKLPLSEANDALRPDGRALLFGNLALMIGFFLLVFCLAWPLWSWTHSRDWRTAEATITRCEVESRHGQHGTEYSLRLLYKFDFEGRPYQSGERNFGRELDEGVADITAWVSAHPTGSKVQCWFNPNDPTQAVLERVFRVGWVAVTLGTFMLAFGIFMLGRAWRARRLRRTLVGARLVDFWCGAAQSKPRLLKVSPHPALVAVACAAGIFPLGWAGASSLTKGIRALLQGQGDLINLLYGAGAVIGAGALVYQAIKFARRAIRPLPELTVSPGTPSTGQEFSVKWKFRGGRDVRWLRLWLEGAEEVKVRRVVASYHGSASEEKTERFVFAMIPLADAAGAQAVNGGAAFTTPAGTMHSFKGVKHAIVWRFKVEFGRNPNEQLQYTLPLDIHPGKA